MSKTKIAQPNKPTTKTQPIIESYRKLWLYRFKYHRKTTLALLSIPTSLILLYLFTHLSLYIRAEHAFRNMPAYKTLTEISMSYDQNADLDNGRILSQLLANLNLDKNYTEKLSNFNNETKHQLSFTTPMSPDVLQAAQSLLTDNKTIINFIDQLPHEGSLRFDGKFNDHTESHLKHLNELRSLSKLLHLRIYINIHNKQYDAVHKDLINLIKIADTLIYEPHHVSILVRRSLNSRYTAPYIFHCLNQNIFTSDQLHKLQQALSKFPIDKHKTLKNAVITNAAVQLRFFEKPHEFKQMLDDHQYFDESPIPHYPVWRFTFLHENDRYRTIQFFNALLTETENKTYQYKICEHLIDNSSEYYLVSRQTPSWDHLPPTIDADIADRNGLILSIAEMRYEIDHQKQPENSSDLVPYDIKQLPDNQNDEQPNTPKQ
ncbi:hypothetical protein JD969_06310 [Planctomycetota bacterium]|nr:hypothetical protein JD969_06310 [Planctomycetota bacterium]